MKLISAPTHKFQVWHTIFLLFVEAKSQFKFKLRVLCVFVVKNNLGRLPWNYDALCYNTTIEKLGQYSIARYAMGQE